MANISLILAFVFGSIIIEHTSGPFFYFGISLAALVFTFLFFFVKTPIEEEV
jgi:hypothetical protein